MLIWQDFHQTQSNHYNDSELQRHDWSSTNPKEPLLNLSLSPFTGFGLQLKSSSKHRCLHIEQPQAQLPPTSTHYYESTSPPEAPPTSTHYYESTSPPRSPAYFHSLLRIYIPSRSLRSASERRLVESSQRGSNHSPEHSRSPILAAGMIPPIRSAGSLSTFKQQLKTSHYLTSS